MKHRTSLVIATVLAVSAGAGTACVDRQLRPLNPCVQSGVSIRVKPTSVDKVDLLLMVDNSGSMGEEQASLAEQIPRLVRTLASGDVGLDGTQDFPPVRDLHVGVVSSDMGVGGFDVPTCNVEPDFGDDGVLRSSGNPAIPGCMATYSPVLPFDPDTDDPEEFSQDVQCVARMGTGGCGFEQQLESVLKALTPSTSSITFSMGTVGHGDGENAGFLRPDSLLAVILLTDENDCSVTDPDLFNPASARYSGDLNLRCFQFPEAVYPVQRYVDGLLALRPGNEDLLVFAGIVGVPPELVPDADHIDYDAVLGGLTERIDPDNPTRLVPSCNVPGRGIAYPPTRIVEAARDIEARGGVSVIQSICQSDFTPALNAIIAKMANALKGACLPRRLNPRADGSVDCDVVEVLPTTGDLTRCDQLASAGRAANPLRIDETGAQVCKVCQQVASDDDGDGVPDRLTPVTGEPVMGPLGMVDCSGAGTSGWYYDTMALDLPDRCPEHPQRISFTTGDEPRTGVTIRLECLQSVMGGGTASIGVGTPCGSPPDGMTPDAFCGSSVVTSGMLCDANSRTCQQRCSTDADCPGGMLCNLERVPGDTGRAICQNPTCEL